MKLQAVTPTAMAASCKPRTQPAISADAAEAVEAVEDVEAAEGMEGVQDAEGAGGAEGGASYAPAGPTAEEDRVRLVAAMGKLQAQLDASEAQIASLVHSEGNHVNRYWGCGLLDLLAYHLLTTGGAACLTYLPTTHSLLGGGLA